MSHCPAATALPRPLPVMRVVHRVDADCRAVVLARCRFVSHARIDRLYFMTDVAEMIQVRTAAELPACSASQF